MRIEIRCSEEQRERWEAAAGMVPLSRWVRTVLDRQVALEGKVFVTTTAEEGLGGTKTVVTDREPVVTTGPAAKRPKDGMCEHRVPAGTFCKKCGV